MHRLKNGILYGIAFALCTFSVLMFLSYGASTIDVLINHTAADEQQGILLMLADFALAGTFAFLLINSFSENKVVIGVLGGILSLVFIFWSLLLLARLANFTVRAEDVLGLLLLRDPKMIGEIYIPLLFASGAAGLVTLPFMHLRKTPPLVSKRST